MSIQALRDQRAAIADELKTHVEKKDWSAANDQPIYDQKMAEIDTIDARIANIIRLNELSASTALNNQAIETLDRASRDQRSDTAKAFANMMRRGENGLSAEDRQILLNTMSTTTGSEGGFTVPTEIATSIIDALKKFGGMREEATVIPTSTGNPMNYPTSDGTSEEGELVDQNASATDADASFGTVPLPVYKFSSKVITVPIELLQDANFDIEAWLQGRLTMRLGRITNRMFTTGTGSNQPNGIIVAASVGVTAATGGATTFSYDNLVDLQHSVDPAYREMGEPCFMMSDKAVQVAKKIKDTTGRPIFLPGYDPANNGAVDRILGDRVCINQSVAIPAANAKSIAYGDFSKYIIRDAMALELQRYADSAYAKKGQVGFLAWLRSGGTLTDTGAVKTFQHSAT